MAAVRGFGFEPTGSLAGPSLNKIAVTIMEPEVVGGVRGGRSKVVPVQSPTSPIERPGSALARGVQITEFKDVRVNPEPKTVEEADVILDDYLSPRKLVRILSSEDLRDLSGSEDLNEVQFLELKVDTRETSLGNFGAHLPNLSQLKLSNSIIFSFRDLGSCLNGLRVLWMSRCGLEDLDGVSSMHSLEELYLAYNEIHDISPCSLLENIKILDLEGNNIDDIHQVQFLEICENLQQLTLEGNPVCMMATPDATVSDYNYRAEVKKYLPQVTLLDDAPLESESSQVRPASAAFEEDWKLIAEFLNEGTVTEDGEVIDQSAARPGTSIRPTTGYRPGSALKQQVNSPLRPASSASKSLLGPGSSQGSVRPLTGSSGRPVSAGRPTTAMRSGSSEDLEEWTDASDLTRGKVVCGNPSKALRARTKQSSASDASSDVLSLLANYRSESRASSSELTQKKADPHLKELFGEIDEWRKDNEKRKASIAKEKEPQILTINHEETLSDEEDSSSDEIDGSKEDEILFSALSQGFGDVNLSNYAGSKKSPERLLRHQEVRPVHSDEAFEVPDDQFLMRESSGSSSSSFGSTNNSAQGPLNSPEDRRPSPGTNSGNKGKFRLNPVKTPPNANATNRPVVRTTSQNHDRTVVDSARTGSAAGVSPTGVNPRRKLPNVSLLPSKTPPK